MDQCWLRLAWQTSRRAAVRRLACVTLCALVGAAARPSLADDWESRDFYDLLLGSSAAPDSELLPSASNDPNPGSPADTAGIESGDVDAARQDASAEGDCKSIEAEIPRDCPLDCPGEHSLWLISSRHVDSCGDMAAAAEQLQYLRYVRGAGWIRATSEEFFAGEDSGLANVFYVHGHRVDPGYAKTGGWDAYRALVQPTASPTRFVIFSWPTTPCGRPLEQFRIKACASEIHAYYLAWVVDRIEPRAPVHLVGYSYGARLITASLHMLGGGMVANRSLSDRIHPDRQPVRASLLAAALDNDWLLPSRRHGRALSQVDRLLVTKNPIDPVLHYYPVVLRNRDAVPLGITGVAGLGRLGDERLKIEQYNVSRIVGKHHAIDNYWQSYTIMGLVQSMSADAPDVEEVNQVGGE